jgi:hypothetical protein
MAGDALVAWSMVRCRLVCISGCRRDRVPIAAIRRSTYSGGPLGSQEFTWVLEKETKRRLTPQKRGPKKKADSSENQETLSFGP